MAKFQINTERRIAFWGAVDRIPSNMRFLESMLGYCGQNTGNLFIGRGMFNGVLAPVKEYWDIYSKSPAEFDERFDCLFIPASNFVFENTDLTDQYEYFSQTKAQIFMFGLGSQTRTVGPIALKPGTERFLRLVADRSSSIGVRGEITAEILSKMGFSNISVVGCPSMLTAPDCFKSLGESPLRVENVAGTFTNNSREHSQSPQRMAMVESQFFDQLVEQNGFYILQNERHELATMNVASWKVDMTESEYFELARVKELFQSRFSLDQIATFLVRRTRIFFDTTDWIRFVTSLDFVFGTRFHGAVAGILAGVPVHILVHDFRTLELCQTYRIPFTKVENIQPYLTCADLYERTSMVEFTEQFSQMCEIWRSFTALNGFDSHVIK